jgi:hypothetical protein
MGVVIFMFQFIRWRVLPIIIIIWGNDPFWSWNVVLFEVNIRLFWVNIGHIHGSILYLAYPTHFKCAILTQKGKENLNKVVNLFCTVIKII